MKTTLSSLLLVASLAGCTHTRPKAPAVALGPYSTPQKAVTVSDRDRGSYVALEKKGTLTLSLEANTSAGYQWKFAQPIDPNVLKVVSTPANQLPAIALPPEGPTKPLAQQWVFQAVGPGTTKLRMIYSRPDRPLDDTATYTLTINAE
jgi:predicted secreted protein